ncbi:MAG: sugar phosphate isomerase/epimerase [Firmicutes bacterium]|nr:sugar phosphate isomerase/epimerase [Bacillota bacterium]
MKLGIISGPDEQGFQYVRRFGLDTTEFCINVGHDAKQYLTRAEELVGYSKQYGVQVASIGRWGTKRVTAEGFNAEEYEQDLALIGLAAALNCPNFVCGCNAVEGMPFEENAQLAARYFKALTEYAQPRGVSILVYNCDWGNIIFDKRGWDAVLPLVPGLGIKYDTSHCINRDGDYLREMMDYGHLIGHFHIKGTLRVHGENIPDPPAGLDDIPWGAVMAILYTHGYEGALSIEPHSRVWSEGPRGDWGVRFTIDMMRRYLTPEEGGADGGAYMP